MRDISACRGGFILRRKLDDPKRLGVLVPVTTFHKFLRNAASCLCSVSHPVSCVIPGASTGKSPVAGLFARHLALSNALSNTEPSAHPSCRTAVCSPIMRPGKRCGCGAQRKRSPQSEGAQIFHDTCLHWSFSIQVSVWKAEEREGVVRSAAAPSRGSAVTQVFLVLPATCQS